MNDFEIKTILKPYVNIENNDAVIDRKHIPEVVERLADEFDDIGCRIDDGLRGESFIIFAVQQNGLRGLMRFKINDATVDPSDLWDIDAIAHMLSPEIQKHGYKVFKDMEKTAALIGDTLGTESPEGQVLSELFRNGLGEVLGEIPYKKDTDLQRALSRTESFLKKQGTDQTTIINVKNIVRRIFVSLKKYAMGRELSMKYDAAIVFKKTKPFFMEN